MNAEIASFCYLLESILTIKILVPVKSFGFIEMVKADRVYDSIIKYLLSKMGNKTSQLKDPIIQYVKNEVEGRSFIQLPLETLSKMD